MEDAADIIRAIASLLWPLVGIVVVLRLLPELRKRIRSGDINVKFGNFELSLQQASDNLRKQVKDLQEAMSHLDAGEQPGSLGHARTRGMSPARGGDAPVPERRAAGRSVLWVDAEPEADAFELSRLEDDGIQVRVVRTSDEAAAALRQRPADVVVVEPAAAVVAQLQEQTEAPIVVYASPDQAAAADALGMAGVEAVVRSPLELFRRLRALGIGG